MTFTLASILHSRSFGNMKIRWDVLQRNSEEDLTRVVEVSNHGILSRLIEHLGLSSKLRRLTTKYEDEAWLIYKQIFIRRNKLPLKYDFASYTRKALSKFIVRTIKISPSCWCIALAFNLLTVGFHAFKLQVGWEAPYNVTNHPCVKRISHELCIALKQFENDISPLYITNGTHGPRMQLAPEFGGAESFSDPGKYRYPVK